MFTNTWVKSKSGWDWINKLIKYMNKCFTLATFLLLISSHLVQCLENSLNICKSKSFRGVKGIILGIYKLKYVYSFINILSLCKDLWRRENGYVTKFSSSTQKFPRFFSMSLLLFCKHKMMIMTLVWQKRRGRKKFTCKRNQKSRNSWWKWKRCFKNFIENRKNF